MYNILANLKNGGEPQKSNKINASLHSPPFSFLIIHIKSISTAYSQNCCQRCFIFSHSNSPQPLIYRGFPSFPTSSRMDSRLNVFLSNIPVTYNNASPIFPPIPFNCLMPYRLLLLDSPATQYGPFPVLIPFLSAAWRLCMPVLWLQTAWLGTAGKFPAGLLQTQFSPPPSSGTLSRKSPQKTASLSGCQGQSPKTAPA